MFSGGFSIWHWLIVGLVVLLLFGKGRFSDMMGDVAKGLKNFKKGMSEDDSAEQRRDPRRARPAGARRVRGRACAGARSGSQAGVTAPFAGKGRHVRN